MIGYQSNVEKFLIFLFTLVVLSMTATSLCFLISSVAPSIAVANFIAVSKINFKFVLLWYFEILVLFFFLLFGGFLVQLPSMPDSVRWLTNFSFLTFSYSILMVNEFNGISILIDPDGMSGTTPVLIEGSLLLEQVGMNVNDLYPYMGTPPPPPLFIYIYIYILWQLLLCIIHNTYINAGVLAGMLGVYMVATYLALRFAVKEKR